MNRRRDRETGGQRGERKGGKKEGKEKQEMHFLSFSVMNSKCLAVSSGMLSYSGIAGPHAGLLA